MDTEPYPPILNDDEYKLVMIPLKAFEFLEIASAIDVGMDIAYGADLWRVWSSWSRAMVWDCSLVLDCINSNPAVRDAIAQLARGGDAESDATTEQLGYTLVNEPACNNDALYGYVRALWLYINTNNIDLLQLLAESTNPAELASIVLGGIPVVSELPLDEVGAYISAVGDWTLEAYEASYVQALEDAIVCDLFCLALANGCSLSVEDVYQYFATKVTSPLELVDNFRSVAEFIASGSWEGDLLIYVMSFMQLGVVILGNRYLEIGWINWYAIHANTGEPDSDWDLLCEDCPDNVWTHTIDFADEDGSFITVMPSYIVNHFGVWVDTSGWEYSSKLWATSPANQYRRGIFISRIFPSSFNVTKMTMNFDLTKGAYSAVSNVAVIAGTLATVLQASVAISSSVAIDGSQALVFESDETIDEISLLMFSYIYPTSSYSGSVRINSLTIEGTGIEPVW